MSFFPTVGRTPLHIAVETGEDTKMVEYFLNNLDVSKAIISKDVQGKTPLMYAAQW